MSAQTILVTGATGRIGACLTRHFRGRGWRVVAVSRSVEKLDRLRADTDGPGAFEGIVADLAADGAAEAMAHALAERDALPHHLVNNARDLAHLRLPEGGYPAPYQWAGEFRLGVTVACDLSLALMRAPGSPLRSIVNVASMYGVVAMNPRLYDDPASQAPIHYGAVKAALIHLTRELAVRLAPQGLRVNAVSYGGVEGRADTAFQARYAAFAPAGRMLGMGDIPGPVDFLTSEAAAAVTGHNLVADGGWTTW